MPNHNLEKIQQTSGRLRLLFTALSYLVPLAALIYWLFFNNLSSGFYSDLPVTIAQELSLTTRCIALVITLLPLSVVIYGLLKLKELFSLYEQGVIFAEQNAHCFLRLGYSLIAWVISNFIFTILISVTLTYANGEGNRLVVVGFGSSELSTLIGAAVVILISRIMKEAAILEAEQAHTV